MFTDPSLSTVVEYPLWVVGSSRRPEVGEHAHRLDTNIPNKTHQRKYQRNRRTPDSCHQCNKVDNTGKYVQSTPFVMNSCEVIQLCNR